MPASPTSASRRRGSSGPARRRTIREPPSSTKGRFTRGNGLMHAIRFRPPAEVPDEEYPFMLSTGRTLYHYNIGNMTRKSARSARRKARISSRCTRRMHAGSASPTAAWRGWPRAADRWWSRARVADKVRPGAIWMPFHFVENSTNRLDQRRFRQHYAHRRVQVLRRQGRKGRGAGHVTKEDCRTWPGFSWWICSATCARPSSGRSAKPAGKCVVADDAAACRTTSADAIVLAADTAGLARAQAHVEAVREKSGTPVILIVDLDRSGWDRTFGFTRVAERRCAVRQAR